jgi:hypothetical protein
VSPVFWVDFLVCLVLLLFLSSLCTIKGVERANERAIEGERARTKERENEREREKLQFERSSHFHSMFIVFDNVSCPMIDVQCVYATMNYSRHLC